MYKQNLTDILQKIAKCRQSKRVDLPTKLLNESLRDRDFGKKMMQFALEYLRPFLPKEENKKE